MDKFEESRSMKKTKQIFICVPHKPHLDPRIEWVAGSLVKEGNLKIVSSVEGTLGKEDRSAPVYTDFQNIIVENKAYHSIFSFFLQVFDLCFPSKKDKIVLVPAAVALIVFDLVQGTFGLLKDIFLAPSTFLSYLSRLLCNYYFFRVTLARFTLLFRRLVAQGKSVFYPSKESFDSANIKTNTYGLSLKGFIDFYLRYMYVNYSSLRYGVENSGVIPDLVYCNDLASLQAGIFLKRKYKAKLVYDAHEIFWDSVNGSPKLFKVIFKWYEEKLLNYVDRFVTVSPQIGGLYLKGVPTLDGKITIMPNACPITEGLESIHTNNGKIRFLYQGVFAPGRGIEDVVRAWKLAKLSNAKLYLRGPSVNNMVEKLKVIAGIDNTIEFLDPVMEKDLVSAAVEFDVGIIPYRPEVSLNQKYCSPNKLGQYMQAGLCIVAARSDFVNSVLEECNCGYTYSSGNIQEISRLFEKICSDSEGLIDKRLAASEAGRNLFNWEVLEPQFLKQVLQ